jgi:hypothetical protein
MECVHWEMENGKWKMEDGVMERRSDGKMMGKMGGMGRIMRVGLILDSGEEQV